MAKRSLSDDEILARIEQEESVAYGADDSELSGDRAKSLDYYLGKPFGNETEGRSQVVSTDVADTIESILPSLLKVFTAGDQVVKFEPRGPEDIDGSEQETDYINHIVLEKNEGFNVFYTWFKDALLSKNGYVKAYWEESEEVETETYYGLSDDELNILISGDEVEVLEYTGYPDPNFLAGMDGANAAQMMQAGAPIQAPPHAPRSKGSDQAEKGLH